ncbi:ABC transporter substrate-binding protein [Spirillospora sp. CA-294931]|uniref:ABC transporter substrate-binding protein n=1 Tax=Spirillospora sp. CA-294931 TaxID=3240042 RepID=UPI003D93946D
MIKVRLPAALLAAGTTLVAAACSATPGSSSSNEGPKTISTTLSSEPVTLTLATSGTTGMEQKLVEGFKKKHPNVTVKIRQTASGADYDKSINLQLASGTGPDIALLNQIGETVKAKLVLDLGRYSDAYKWESSFASTVLDQFRVSEDGRTFGTGSLYALPSGGSLVGVYYNKKLGAKIGMTAPPRSLGEFEAALGKAKAAGVLPIQLGNLEGHASFIVQAIADQVDSPATVNAWAYGKPGSKFDSPGTRQGLAKLKEWTGKGYIPSGANGADLPKAVAEFAGGEGLFLFDGNWDAATLDKKLGADVGFFTLPPVKAGGKGAATGSGFAFAVSAKSKHPDAAAAFLDYFRGPEASRAQFESGVLPVDTKAVQPVKGRVVSDVVAAYDKVIKDDGLVAYYNNAAPGVQPALTSNLQSLIGGKTSPDAVITAVQAAWTKFHS